MKLALSQPVGAPAEVVWRLISEPSLINRWSEAEVRLLAPGDGGRADTVGAYREIRIAAIGRTTSLREVISEVDPPRELHYRVVETPLVRSHAGRVRIAPGTLTWDVEYELAAPGLGAAMKLVLEKQLGASLKALARVAAELEPSPLPPPRELDDTPGADLWTAAERILEDQRALADRLEAANDPKRWFSRVYEYVTEAQLRAAREGGVRHVGWVLRLVPKFHEYYLHNLQRRTGELAGWPEAHWTAAFDAMEGKGRRREPRLMLFLGLLGGIRAHIEEDLPRALAEVWVENYAGRCDYARFRADYLTMAPIFRNSSDRLIERVPREHLPWYTRWFGGVIPPELAESMRRKNFYDIGRARRQAFERGARLAELLQRHAKSNPVSAPASPSAP